MGNLRTGNKRHNRAVTKAVAAIKGGGETVVATVKKAAKKG